MSDLIQRLRNRAAKQDKEGDMHVMREAADALEAANALVTLLRASLRKSEDEVDALRKDAGRYRWLRRQQWNEAEMFVVAGSKSKVRLGTDCPSLVRLDDAIDAAMTAAQPDGAKET